MINTPQLFYGYIYWTRRLSFAGQTKATDGFQSRLTSAANKKWQLGPLAQIDFNNRSPCLTIFASTDYDCPTTGNNRAVAAPCLRGPPVIQNMFIFLNYQRIFILQSNLKALVCPYFHL